MRLPELRRLARLERLPRPRRRLQRRAPIRQLKRLLIHLLRYPLPPNPEWLRRRLLLRPLQDLELRRLRRVREFRLDLQCPVSRVLLRRSDLPQQLQREARHRHQEPAREHLDPPAVLLRRARDFRFVPVERLPVGSRVPAHLRVFVPQPPLDKRVRAAHALVCHCAREADLREDILSVRVAPANEAAGPIKDLSADNVPAQPAEQEFRKLNPASRFTRANLPRRAAVRSSKSVTRKVNANSIRCAPARVRALGERRKPNLWRRYSASHGK